MTLTANGFWDLEKKILEIFKKLQFFSDSTKLSENICTW